MDKLYDIFKKMPKLANLHIHLSGFVSYKVILNHILKEDLYTKIYVDTNLNMSFYKEYNNVTYKLMTKDDITTINNKLKQQCTSMKDMHALGYMFYGVIKNVDFYKNYYLPEIIKKMERHNLKYMEIRVKLGGVVNDIGNSIKIIDELDLLIKYKDYFKIIIQHNKCNSYNDVYNYFEKIILLTKDTPYNDFIKGYDITGDENKCNTIQYHYDKLLELKNKYSVQYYLHAGEIMNNPKSLINLEYALKLNPIRIGHGIIAFENKKLLDDIYKDKLTLEICPISNKMLYNYKLNINNIIDNINIIVIGSDDDNKLKSNITHDYLYLYKLGLTLDQIKILISNNIKFMDNYDINDFNVEFDTFINTYESIFISM